MPEDFNLVLLVVKAAGEDDGAVLVELPLLVEADPLSVGEGNRPPYVAARFRSDTAALTTLWEGNEARFVDDGDGDPFAAAAGGGGA